MHRTYRIPRGILCHEHGDVADATGHLGLVEQMVVDFT